MDHCPTPDSYQGKGSVLRHRDHCDDSIDNRPTDISMASPAQEEKRPIRRVRSPSRPRAWMSNTYKPKMPGQLYKPQDQHPLSKHSFSYRRYHHFYPRTYFQRRDHFQPKLPPGASRERERVMEKERYEQRESSEGNSPHKQNSTTRAFLPRSSSSRDKDMQFNVGQSDRNQSRERDHKQNRSKERERSGDRESSINTSQMVARDRAIQQKRREIDEVYYQECEMFGLVAKMLIAKDQSLERSIQSSLQENLRDIGKRCLEAMEKFIEDYDSREPSH